MAAITGRRCWQWGARGGQAGLDITRSRSARARRTTSACGEMRSNPCGQPGCTCSSTELPAGGDAAGVLDRLVPEDVKLPDLDVGGRQSGQVRRAGRGGGIGHVRVADEVAEQGVPVRCSYRRMTSRPTGPARVGDGGAVVEHRVDEDLLGQRRRDGGRGRGWHGGGDAAAAAVAHDGDPGRVHAQFRGVGGQPGQAGVGVLDGSGMGDVPGRAGSPGEQGDAAVGRVGGDPSIIQRHRPMIMPPPCR